MTIDTDGPPERVSLRKLLDQNPLPKTPTLSKDFADTPPSGTDEVIRVFSDAFVAEDFEKLQDCFYEELTNCNWRDQFALTCHIRTFQTRRVVSANLLATKRLRGVEGGFAFGAQQAVFVHPNLGWLDCSFTFETKSPAAKCSGRLLLLPYDDNGTMRWKIWTLCTWLAEIHIQPENPDLLKLPGRDLSSPRLETDVVIIGGGNGAACTAARLKALGVDSIMLERNAHAGDNWALRYDSLRFHIPTSICHMPYLPYPAEFQTPGRLTRDALANHLRLYIQTFHLNLLTSSKIQSTTYNTTTKLWEVSFYIDSNLNGGADSDGVTVLRTITAKHLVQATGIASQKAYLPDLPNRDLYRGVSIHSNSYRNASTLLSSLGPLSPDHNMNPDGNHARDQDQDCKKGKTSILIIGSANTAFDILTDLTDHSSLPELSVTMSVRSSTYIVPESYFFQPIGLGMFDALPTAAADILSQTGPMVVDGHLMGNLLHHLALSEPERYAPLRQIGFPVTDSADISESLICNLVERAGGHYVDIGGTVPLEQKKAGFVTGTPVEWTERGLKYADGKVVEADGVVWCTGFADQNVRDTLSEILGDNSSSSSSQGEKGEKPEQGEGREGEEVLGAKEIAARAEATWGVDAEGEIRGMWKRHERMERFWVMGGGTGHHRWFSQFVAMQIRLDLEGLLPEAYRETRDSYD